MNILILNSILFTADNNRIPQVQSIKDTMIYGMCLGFKSLGHQITLAAAEEYKPAVAEEYDFEVLFFKSRWTKLFPPSVLPYSYELKSYLKENRESFDFIISSEVFSFQSLFAAQICPRKTIIWQELTCHQSKLFQIPSKIWHNIVTRFFMKRIVAIVPRSQSAYMFVAKYMPQTVADIVDHGIDTDKFQYSTEKKRYIITSSQLIYRKNVDGIIYKFKEFTEDDASDNIKLLIAGKGEEENRLKNLVNVLHLKDRVCFLGFLPQKELNQYIRYALCFLVNTRKDLNMVSIPEAIVSGTPILTNMQPASAVYIKEKKLGIARDNWGKDDIQSIIVHNREYVNNCISYRDKLTNTYSAKLLVTIFIREISIIHEKQN